MFEHYLAPTYTISKLSLDDNERIKETKSQFVIDDARCFEYIRFPGFKISSNTNILEYKEFYDSTLSKVFTPPRGNLSKDNNFLILGIRPGKMFDHLPHEESAWLFGPCSKMLHRLLLSLHICPYFTNVYKNWNDQNRKKSIEVVIKEIALVMRLMRKSYDTDKIKVICLGNYSEYDDIARVFSKVKDYIDIIRIWHPSYLCREFTVEKFNKWQNMLKNTEVRLL